MESRRVVNPTFQHGMRTNPVLDEFFFLFSFILNFDANIFFIFYFNIFSNFWKCIAIVSISFKRFVRIQPVKNGKKMYLNNLI